MPQLDSLGGTTVYYLWAQHSAFLIYILMLMNVCDQSLNAEDFLNKIIISNYFISVELLVFLINFRHNIEKGLVLYYQC